MSNHREMGQALLSKVVMTKAAELCEGALMAADLGAGLCSIHALETEHTPARALVVVLYGPIPDDLIQSLGNYVTALSQDLKADGKIKTIYEG